MADNTGSLDVALGMAHQCGLTQLEARQIIAQVQDAVAGWRENAAAYGLSARDIAWMESAFTNQK